MSDGAVLSVARYPAPVAPAPVVVQMTPYRKEAVGSAACFEVACHEGYDVLVADVRGFGGSTGPYEGLMSPREIDDGVELLEWAARQAFCDGRTAMIGPSYMGMNQLMIAARRPRGLRCIAPSVGSIDWYRDCCRRGGIPSTAPGAPSRSSAPSKARPCVADGRTSICTCSARDSTARPSRAAPRRGCWIGSTCRCCASGGGTTSSCAPPSGRSSRCERQAPRRGQLGACRGRGGGRGARGDRALARLLATRRG